MAWSAPGSCSKGGSISATAGLLRRCEGLGPEETLRNGVLRLRTMPLGMTAILALFALALSQPNAAANMRPLTELEMSVGMGFILFLVNLPINLFAFSTLLLLTCTVWGKQAGQFPKGDLDFLIRTLVTVLLITLLGVLIDLLFLYSSEAEYVFEYDLLKWLAASAAVGLTVYVLSLTMLRMDILFGAIPALAMMALNLVSWRLTMELSASVLCLVGPSMFFLILSLTSLMFLDRWHKNAFAHELAEKV